MSLSKPMPLCRFCEAEKGKYMCPRCNIRYCSAKCYKDPAHERCTEMFFQEWVMSTLREQSAEEAEKRRMLELLKGASQMEEDSDNDVQCMDSENLPIEERFRDLNLGSDVDEKEIWDRLNEKEKDHFKSILKDENELGKIIPIKEPWWSIKHLNLVRDSEDMESSDGVADRPPFPIEIKPLSTIIKRPLARTIQFDVVNVLYAYAFLAKFHNFELRGLIDDCVNSLIYLSPVLSQQKNYLSLDESIQDSIRLLTGSHFQVAMTHAKALCSDVYSIIEGPSNAQPHTYIICAVNDLKMLVIEFKVMSNVAEFCYPKSMQQVIERAQKKLEFYLSWTADCYESEMKPILAEIQLKYMPEIINDHCEQTFSNDFAMGEVKPEAAKMLIEEVN